MNQLLSTIFVAVVACVTAFSAHAQELKGDAKAGANKNSLCIGCHGIVGYQASFPEVHKVPKISGQGAKYIASALNAYKKGERKHPTMRGIAESLSDQDIADLSAYYSQHGVVAGAAAPAKPETVPGPVAELLKKGACLSCHGDNFSKPIDPSYPKLAGQHPDYLFVALKAYQVTANPKVGRGNAIMGGVCKSFSSSDLKVLANYIGSLPGEMKVVPQGEFR